MEAEKAVEASVEELLGENLELVLTYNFDLVQHVLLPQDIFGLPNQIRRKFGSLTQPHFHVTYDLYLKINNSHSLYRAGTKSIIADHSPTRTVRKVGFIIQYNKMQ